MAPRRKPRASKPGDSRDYKIRLPEDIAQRIEQKAKDEGRPQNRIIINELAQIPYFEGLETFDDNVRQMEIVLARYGARITFGELSEQLLKAIDKALEVHGSELETAMDKVRVLRREMLKLKKGIE